MSQRRRPLVVVGTRALAGLVAALALGVVLAVALWRLADGSLSALTVPGPGDPSDGIILAAAVMSLLLVGWLAVVVVVEAASLVPGATGGAARALSDRLAPLTLRRGVSVVLGTALATGLSPAGQPSQASPVGCVAVTVAAPDPSGHAPGAPLTASAGTDVPDPSLSALARRTGATSPLPDLVAMTTWTPTRAPRARTVAPPVDLVSRSPAPGSPVIDEVVVRRGDTLWEIAARFLGPGVDAAEVAQAWPRWYSANRDVIGDDPGLILPGTRLRHPTVERAS